MSFPVGRIDSPLTTPYNFVRTGDGPPRPTPSPDDLLTTTPTPRGGPPTMTQPVLGVQRGQQLEALRAAVPAFDFSRVRAYGGSSSANQNGGSDVMQQLSDGTNVIAVTRNADGQISASVRSTPDGEERPLDATPAMRRDLAQAFRLAATRERAESLAGVDRAIEAWDAREREVHTTFAAEEGRRAAAGLPPRSLDQNRVMPPSPRPSREGIERGYASRLTWANSLVP